MAAVNGEVQVTLLALTATGAVVDAVQLPLVIHPLAVRDVHTVVGDFTGALETTFTLPVDAAGPSLVRLELSRSLAGPLLNGLHYLTGFPYGCVEQTMSKALPNAVVGRALRQLGVSDPTLQADLPAQINASVQRLYGFQHNDGGWGWWFDDQTDDYQTAWVVFGLATTAQAGYEVDLEVVARGAQWLIDRLSNMDPRTRAFALYSLAVAGHGDLDATRAAAQRASTLDPFSQAGLALALHYLGDYASARSVLSLLALSAVEQNGLVHWETGVSDGHYGAKTMSSAMRSTALALAAFVAIDPNHQLEPGIVRYLMANRREYGWGSTNETSFALLALTDHLVAKETATAGTEYTVELNGRAYTAGTLGHGEPAVTLEIPLADVQAGTNTLRLTQSGGGRLYYVLSRQAYLPRASLPASGVVAITRRYLDAETGQPLTSTVPVGRLVRVVLTVDMPASASYVLVEDRLPGGLEALNESLNTTAHDSLAAWYNDTGYGWQSLGYNHKEVHGDRVSFFITELTAGQHTFNYYARAVQPGRYVALPAEAWAMYDASVWGRSPSAVLVIEQ